MPVIVISLIRLVHFGVTVSRISNRPLNSSMSSFSLTRKVSRSTSDNPSLCKLSVGVDAGRNARRSSHPTGAKPTASNDVDLARKRWGRAAFPGPPCPCQWGTGGKISCVASLGRGPSEALGRGAGRAESPVSWDGARKKGLRMASEALSRAGRGGVRQGPESPPSGVIVARSPRYAGRATAALLVLSRMRVPP